MTNKEAIRAVDFLPDFKLLMKFHRKFYPDAINCKVADREKVYYDVAFKKEAQANVLGLLSTGSSAEYSCRLGAEEEIVSDALEELDQIFKGKASELYAGDYLFENWDQHQFSFITWTNAATNKKFSLKALNQPLKRKVHFAGEIYHTHKQLGVPGAILSGYDSIDRLLENEELSGT